jgi:uncharacterized protein (TIGR02145 family)
MSYPKCLPLLIVAFLGCTDIPDDLREDANSDGTCGSSLYNPSTSFCYEGNVYAKCDGIKYNPTTHICQGIEASLAVCGGSRRYNPLEEGCCASTLFSLADQRCLGDVVETKCGTGGYYYNTSTQFCNGNSVYDKCNGQNYTPGTQKCQSNFIETKCGANGWYNAVNQRCQNDVVETKCGSGWYIISNTNYCVDGTVVTVKGEFTDTRDGKTYKYITIGTQNWMAENLKYNATGSKCGGDDGKTLSDTNTAACDTYGRLYDWTTAMGISNNYDSTYYNPSSSTKYQGVCPEEWHIPNIAELETLIAASGGASATKLKATSGWDDVNGESVNGTDSYGFSALPGSYGDGGTTFGHFGTYGLWWIATEFRGSLAYNLFMYFNFENVYVTFNGKSRLFSVRCLQD